MKVLICTDFTTSGTTYRKGDIFPLHYAETNRYGKGQYLYLTDAKKSFSAGIPEFDGTTQLAATLSDQAIKTIQELNDMNLIEEIINIKKQEVL